MRKLIWIYLFCLACATQPQNQSAVKTELSALEENIGVLFNDGTILIKTWSPQSEVVRLNLYDSDLNREPRELRLFTNQENGIWSLTLDQALYGAYYTIQAKQSGKWSEEVPGIYAKAVGRNGKRGQLIDPSKSNPEGWEKDEKPNFNGMRPNDFLVYELHIRDFSIAENSGLRNKGKFIAFAETGTVNKDGLSTGIDHLVEMGVTHVHLLPSFDYHTVDESRLDEPQYNWGYDPHNYNVPEGSYSTNPQDGATRIREFKSMVKALHDKGIGVVMDVVYNHTSRTDGLSFEELVPSYYYRQWSDSTLGNASGCGNEMASDQPMMRKFMVESLKYWVEEYHIDGFRFDLMAIHDIETMNLIQTELRKLNPNILLYGEGWTAGDSPLPAERRALKAHTYQMPGIAAFSDEIRDGLKGHWSSHESKGFVSSNFELKGSVKFGVIGGIQHPQIDYSAVNNSDAAWALEPHQCMVYVSCHDNHTLYDKLKIANPEASEKDIREMHLLSNFVVLTSQGVPFLHAGVEFLRTKNGVENSYKSADSINQIDWDQKSSNIDHVKKYQELISLRKSHPSFRLKNADEVRKRLRFLDTDERILAYLIDSPEEDGWKRVMVMANGSNEAVNFTIPEGRWQLEYFTSGSTDDYNSGQLAPRTGYILAERR